MTTNMSRYVTFTFALVLFLWLIGNAAHSFAEVETISGGSIVLEDFGLGDDEAFATAVQEDGKILVAGYTYNGAEKQLFIARYGTDGVLDSSFNTSGVFKYSTGGENFVADSMVVRDDGSILVSATGGAASAGYVFQLDTDGFLDKSWAADGIYTKTFSSSSVTKTALSLKSDGKLLLMTATENSDGNQQLGVVELTSSGVVDSSYGEDGAAVIDSSLQFRGLSVAETSDGALVVGGSVVGEEIETAAIMKISATGQLVTSFGESGILKLFDTTVSSKVNSVITDEDDGLLYVGGTRVTEEISDSFIAKISNSGAFDTDFGSSGIVSADLGYKNSLYALALTDDGILTATGFAQSGDDQDVFILTISGLTTTDEATAEASNAETSDAETTTSQTPSVAMNIVDIMSADDTGYAVAIADSGEVYIAGSSENGDDLDVALLMVSDATTLAASGQTLQAGVTTDGFTIFTLPVTEITHTGAMTGGQIVDSNDTTSTCAESCTEDCADEDDTDTCYSDCTESCSSSSISVTLYGVVYGTKPSPEYESSDSDSTDTTDNSDSTDSTDDSTDSTDSIFPQGDLLDSSIVHSGWTEDGSGTGTFESEITDITPGITYYVRAFAVLSDGTVIYGNERSFSTEDGCFIATAAYGSIFSVEVTAFRWFRDSYLLTNRVGEKLVAIYYRVSPPISDVIRDHEWLRFAVRLLLFPVYLLVASLKLFGAGVVLGFFILAGASVLWLVRSTRSMQISKCE